MKLTAYAVILLAGIMAWAAGCSPKTSTKQEEPSASAPESEPSASDFIVPRLNGDTPTIKLSDYAGRVVLLDFWATWCPPCKAELPELNELYQEWKDRGLVLIGMTVDQGEPMDITEAVKAFNLSYPVALAHEDVQRVYGGIRAVPTKFLLDQRGIVRQCYVGRTSMDIIRKDIDALLNAPPL